MPNNEILGDRERLRYVVEHLKPHEALGWVGLGAWLVFAGFAHYYFLETETPLVSSWLSALVGGGLMLLYLVYVPRYYERRFGWIKPQIAAMKEIAIVVAIVVVFWVFAKFVWPKGHSPISEFHLKLSDPRVEINLFGPVIWIVLFFSSMRWYRQAFARPRLYGLALIVLTSTLIPLYAIWYPDAKQIMTWRILNACYCGFCFIAVGLCDHLTLVRLLPRKLVEGENG